MKTRKILYMIGNLLLSLLVISILFLSPTAMTRANGASPRIAASYQHNDIEFDGFTKNTDLHFEIFSSQGGDLLYADTLQTDSNGRTVFSAWDSFDIDIGQYISASDGATTKDVLVVNARYDMLDVDSDLARGIAPQYSQVKVCVWGLDDYHELATQTGQNGTWVADFSAAGQDILSTYSTNAYIFDEDGDATIAWVPHLEVWNYGTLNVEGSSFTSGGPLTVEIYDAVDGTLLYKASDITADNDHGGFQIPLGQHGQNLQAGVHVVVIDQTTGENRQLTLQPVTLDIFDYESEVVEGTAPAGSTISVRAFTSNGYFEIMTEVGADGKWLQDFNIIGADLNPSDDVNVLLYDLDGDATRSGLVSFLASITEDFVHWGWHAAPVTVTIYDPNGDTVFGPEVFTERDSMGIAPWTHVIDLQPDCHIDIEYSDNRVIDLTMADLSVDNVDRDADWAEGSAPAGTTVTVMVYDMDIPYWAGSSIRARMDVSVNSSGYWRADFSTQNFDITNEFNVAVMLSEFDGGTSAAAASWVWPPPNTTPVVDLFNGPDDPVLVNSQVYVSADFNDPDVGDTHTAVWYWGDESSSAGSIDEDTDVASGIHTYTEPGVYVLHLMLCDSADACDIAEYQYVVVYDPNAGFVTGGGWIMSPAGAYVPNPDLTGKATFGFVSKYKKGASVPDGNAEFQFKAGDLNFKSTSYEWLVVNQKYTNAQFKGNGTINGEGNYGFMIWAGDGFPDTLRIKIWDAATGAVVYDNGVQQPIGGGSIVIHK